MAEERTDIAGCAIRRHTDRQQLACRLSRRCPRLRYRRAEQSEQAWKAQPADPAAPAYASNAHGWPETTSGYRWKRRVVADHRTTTIFPLSVRRPTTARHK